MKDTTTTHPLSFPQKSLWMISQSGVDNGAYNLHLIIKINTSIGINKTEIIIHDAGLNIVRRHSQLRSNFILEDDEPVQIIHSNVDFRIHVEDCSALSSMELEAKTKDYSSRPFNLEKDVLFRVFLFSLRDKEILLLLACPHIVMDGLSAEIVFQELVQYIHASLHNISLELPLPLKHYRDFVEYESALINGISGERRLQYWHDELLQNTGHTGISADFDRPPVFSHQGKAKKFRVNNGIYDFMGHSAFTVLLSAYFLLLSGLSGSNDITVVIPLMNREEDAFKSIIGYFVNMAFIRVSIHPDQSFNQLLDIVDGKIKNARMHQYPFQLIFKKLGFKHEANRFPLSDLFFETVKVKYFKPHDRVSLGDDENIFDIEFCPIQQDSTPGDITVQFYEYRNSHYLEIRYREDLFMDETIEGFINNFIETVNTVTRNPGICVSDVLQKLHPIGSSDKHLELHEPGSKSGQTRNEKHESFPAAEAIGSLDPIHQILLDIWKDVLNQNDISIHDDFFSLGGQSLMAIKVISRINRLFNTNLSVKSFFQNLSIYKLAGVVRYSIQGNDTKILPRIESAGQKEHYPLSFSQERMWFLHELEPESIAYNFVIPIRFVGDLNIEILVESYKKVVQRHDQLHSNFYIVDGRPVQAVKDDYDVYYNIVELSGSGDEDPENEARRIAEMEVLHHFDLKNEPLVRLTVISLDKRDNIILLNMHHIISDEWSLAVITYELCEIYKSSGQDDLFPLPLRYVDFSVWQRNVFAEESFNSQMEYWKKQLDGMPVLNLPIDKQRPVVQTYSGSYYKEKIHESLIKKIHETGGRHGVTAYMVLLACFFILLHRYSGQDDLAVASPVANRTRVETEGMIGTFVNTLVLRGDLHGNPSFRELLQRIKETVIGAFTNQDLPFERLVEELRPKRDMSILPLAQVLFNVMNVPFVDNFPENIQWQIYEIEVVGVQFDLVMAIEYELLNEITLSYNKDLFDSATARQILDHYLNILEIVLADNNVRINDIAFLKDQELSRILSDWNSNPLFYPGNVIYPQVFEDQARRNPGKTAVIFEDKKVTYAELNSKANRLARHLIARKPVNKPLIGIYLNRSDEMLACLIAVMKTGGSYLPLDPTYPDDRVVFMIEDSQVDVIISESALMDCLTSYRDRIILVDAIQNLKDFDDSNFPNKAGPGDLAYTIYTSGSTGKPKGVQIEHRSLLNFLYSMKEKPGITESDRLCAVTPISFDISVLELFLPILAGATVIIAPREFTIDGRLLLKHIKDNNATMMQATPSTWRLLVEAGWNGEALQKVLCGGEAIPRDLAENILNRGLTVWNLYGPTETTVWSTIYHIENKYDPILIGKPIGNTKTYILDASMKPVPSGVAGELFIGGDGVARGYLNRPELTSEKFIINPFSEKKFERIYRTGDLARYRHDGNIEFLGRNDQQVKVRGHRIELGEINAVVAQYGGIKYAVTVVREDCPGDKRIVTYFVKDDSSGSIRISDLKEYAKKEIPAYMVPAFFIEMQKLPLLPNGKVNIHALPAPDEIEPEKEVVNPQNHNQEMLVEIWQEVMNVKKIGIRDNFFDLGGYSLLAVRLMTRVNEAFKIDLPLRTLFLNPDIESLSRVINSNIKVTAVGDIHESDRPDTRGALYPHEEKYKQQNASVISAPLSIFPMQPKGNRPSLFIISGVHVEEDGFYRYLSCIIPSLGLDQPVYGLRPRGLLGDDKPHDNISEMAADYIKEIKLIQSHGPYFIGGECIGGLAAYEIARQLERNNENVGVLLLLDTFHVSALKNFFNATSRCIADCMMKSRRIFLFLVRHRMNIVEALTAFITRKIKAGLPEKEKDNKMEHIRNVEKHYIKALRKYRPERIKSKIVLIANEEDNALERDLGWGVLYNTRKMGRSHGCEDENFNSIVVKGNHLTRLTVYGLNTGTVIRKVIDEASLKC